jgi:hypothetical protein
MSDPACALRPDGSLKDATEIEFFNDVDDDVPMAAVSTASASRPLMSSFSQGKLDAFVSRVAPATVVAGSRRSGRALKPTEKVREAAAQSIPTKRTAPSDVSSAPVRRRVSAADVTDTEDLFEDEDGETGEDDDMPDLQEVSDDEDDEAEAAYQRTKAFGDIDRDVIPQFYIHIY